MEGKGEMIKAPISLQDLRRSLYVKAKAEPAWRFWGLYVHVCKMETLGAAYEMAKNNDGAPGSDGVTFEAIENDSVGNFLRQIRDELVTKTYRPMRARRKEIPKDNGKVRVLSIPSIRDRVVQGALKLILEPIFEADFQDGSFAYRPKKTAHQAVHRVAQAIVQCKTRIIDIDLRGYFDNVKHHILLEKVARRVEDGEVLHLLKMMLTVTGKQGVPQGGVISPLLSNVLLTPFDWEMRRRGYLLTRYADDWVITCASAAEARAALDAATRVLKALGVHIHPQKTRIVHVRHGFEFLGYKIKRGRRQLKLPVSKIRSGVRSGDLYAYPRQKSIHHFKDQVRRLTRRKAPISTEELIQEIKKSTFRIKIEQNRKNKNHNT